VTAVEVQLVERGRQGDVGVQPGSEGADGALVRLVALSQAHSLSEPCGVRA
jgi:hypothetical protein